MYDNPDDVRRAKKVYLSPDENADVTEAARQMKKQPAAYMREAIMRAVAEDMKALNEGLENAPQEAGFKRTRFRLLVGGLGN